MKIAIVQARLQSTRLPRKILLPLAGEKTALECMLARVRRSERIDEVVVAASDTPADRELHAFLDSIGQPYVAGSEDDVLDRYYTAAKASCGPGDTIVRLTSDCPVLDARVIDRVIRFYEDGKYDFASNSLEPCSWPDGMDTEVFSFDVLERAAREATLPSHREHVTFYMWQNPDLFRIGYLKNETDQSSYRLTLDYPGDYEVLKRIYEHFSPRMDFTLAELVQYLDAHPEVRRLNDEAVRNAGWQSALKKDTIGG
jgi:spore coat polysaccharide biosynthesis protein SpsF